jgi:hypothetical protein
MGLLALPLLPSCDSLVANMPVDVQLFMVATIVETIIMPNRARVIIHRGPCYAGEGERVAAKRMDAWSGRGLWRGRAEQAVCKFWSSVRIGSARGCTGAKLQEQHVQFNCWVLCAHAALQGHCHWVDWGTMLGWGGW